MQSITLAGDRSYQITRDGGHISVNNYSMGHYSCAYTIDVAQDKITVRRGPTADPDAHNYDITLNKNSIDVLTHVSSGLRCVPEGYSITSTQKGAFSSKNFEQIGLAVASSLTGVPLIFPEVTGGQDVPARVNAAPSLSHSLDDGLTEDLREWKRREEDANRRGLIPRHVTMHEQLLPEADVKEADWRSDRAIHGSPYPWT